MFETLKAVPADSIFALMAEYKADTRESKVDLGIGVYKDQSGRTPVLGAVRKAEERVFAEQASKTYVGVAGNKGFCEAIADLAFAGSVGRERLAAVQAPGGTGALWVLLQVIKRARPDGQIYLSDPTWPNHLPMCVNSGIKVGTYPYFDPVSRAVKYDAMLGFLDGLGPNDSVLLHACCHNPTGANLSNAQWDAVAQSLLRTGAFPVLDLAYLGFGDGLDQDAYGLRKLASTLDELLLGFSCSKNFGLYRERVGAAFAVGKDAESARILAGNMSNIARTCYSQPPDHGAEIVRVILSDPSLRAEWEAELEAMRLRMGRLRQELVSAIRARSNNEDFDFLVEHSGMFSLLGLTAQQVGLLKDKFGVYMTDDSRINVAGIPEAGVGELADAVLSVLR